MSQYSTRNTIITLSNPTCCSVLPQPYSETTAHSPLNASLLLPIQSYDNFDRLVTVLLPSMVLMGLITLKHDLEVLKFMPR
jgi:hypothetical protein